MKLLLYALTAIGCLALAAASFIWVAAPTEAIQHQLAAAFKARTGRDLVVSGGTSLSFFPVAGVTLEDVSVIGPQDVDGEAMVRIERLRLQIPLWPLLRRQFEVTELTIERPRVRLITDQNGRMNWRGTGERPELADGRVDGDDSLQTAADEAAEPSLLAGAAGGELADLALADVRVIGGSVDIEDRREDRHDGVSDINVTFSLDSLDRPLRASGSLVWREQDWPIDFSVASVKALLAGEPAALELSTKAAVATLEFEGEVSLAEDLRLSGTADFRSPSLRRLIEIAGFQAPRFGGLGALSISGKLDLAKRVASFADATLSLDGWSAQGSLSVPFDAPRPTVVANLAIEALDLNPYLAAAPADGVDKLQATAAAQPEPGADDPQPEAVASTSGGDDWSDEPYDFSGLKSADIIAELKLGSLTYRKIKLDRSRLSARLGGGLLTVKFGELALYAGQGSGELSVDTRGPVAKVALAADLAGINSRRLLRDALAIDWLAGNGTTSFKLAAVGGTLRDWVASLAGSGKLGLRDGAIVGFNLPQTIRGLEEGRLDGFASGSTAKTDFSTLDATFSIAAGKVDNKDLQLAGPLLRLSGAGAVLLPSRSLDYLAHPKLVASLEGQGGDSALAGIEIPVKLTGPWRRPKLKPDLSAVLKDPKATAEAAKKIGETLKGNKGVKKLLDALGDDKTKAQINEALGKLLGNSN